MSISTELRRIVLVGPRLASPADDPPSEEFAWEAELSVAYQGADRHDRSLVNSTLGLRVLLQDSTTDNIEVNADGVKTKVRLHRPRLLVGNVHARQYEKASQANEPRRPRFRPWQLIAAGLGLLIVAMISLAAALLILGGFGLIRLLRQRSKKPKSVLPQHHQTLVTSTLVFPGGDSEYSLRAPVAGPDADGDNQTLGFFTVAVTPVDSWPTPQSNTDIVVPRFALAEHRVRVLVSVKGGTPSQPLGFMQFAVIDSDPAHVAAFLPKIADVRTDLHRVPRIEVPIVAVEGPDSERGPFVAVDLTPDGIELHGTVLNPMLAFDAKAVPPRLDVVLRLVHAVDPLVRERTVWTLELVREVDPSQTDGKGYQIRKALACVRKGFVPDGDKPIFVDIDTHGDVPAVRWPLVLNDDHSLSLPRDGREDWRLWVDAKASDARLTGAPFRGAELASVVMVVPDRVEIIAAQQRVTVTVDADRRNPSRQNVALQQILGPHVEVTWEKTQARALTISNDGSKPVSWFFDQSQFARELVDRYTKRGVHPPTARTTYTFVPIVGGWLQLPIPIDANGDDDVDEPAANDAYEAPQEAVPFGGRFETLIPITNLKDDLKGAGPSGRRLTVSGADHVIAQTTFVDGIVESIQIKFRGAAGSADGILWTASASPSPEEVLPSLAAGPVSLVGPTLQFRRPTDATRNLATILSTAFSPDRDFELTLPKQGGATAYIWQGYSELPLITAAPITRTSMGSGLPSETRGLLCREVDRTKLEITLTHKRNESVPLVGLRDGRTKLMPYDCPLLEPSAQEAIPLVAVTTTGIEFKPATASFSQLQVRLSYGLPILDDYFASIRLPETTPVAPPNSVKTDPPPVDAPTSLDMAALSLAWQRAVDRLDLSRVQASMAFAFRPQALGDALIQTLFGRTTWTTTFVFKPVSTIDGQILAFGSYRLDSVDYSGERALHGLTKAFEVAGTALKPATGETQHALPVVGFAAAAWKDPASGMWRDSRGALAAERPVTVPFGGDPHGLVLRQTQVIGSTGTADYWRATAAMPVSIEPPPGNEGRKLALWFRDLPLESAGAGMRRFSPTSEDVELAVGPLQSSFDPERLPRALYEWRFCNDDKAKPNSPSLYDIAIGPFRFRPLRLLALALSENGEGWAVTGATVIGSLTPPGESGLNAEHGPFGPESDYRTGNLVAVSLRPIGPHGLTFKTAKWQKASVSATSVAPGGLPNVSFRRARVPVCLGRDQTQSPDITTLRLDLTFASEATDDMPAFSSAAMETILFGRRVRYVDGTVRVSPDEIIVTFARRPDPTPTPFGDSGIVLNTVQLVWPLTGAPRLVLDGELSLSAVDANAGNPAKCSEREVVWQRFGGALWWLNLEIPNTNNSLAMEVDHLHGVIHLNVDCKITEGSRQPIAGLTAAEPDIRATLVMATAAGSERAGSPFEFRSRSGFGALSLLSRDGPTQRFDQVLVADAIENETKGPTWTSNIEVDLTLQAHTSRIHWPVGSLPKAVQPPEQTLDFALQTLASNVSGRVLRGKLGAYQTAHALRHSLTLRVTDQPVPTDALGITRNASGRRVALTAPWSFTALVTHTLTPETAAEGAAQGTLHWTTLDHVTAVDARELVEDARDAFTLPDELSEGDFAFAARYRFTDVTAESKAAIKGGLVLRAFAQAGFPVEALARHVADGMFDAAGELIEHAVGDGIVLTGAGATAVVTADVQENAFWPGTGGVTRSGRDRHGVLLSLPWLTAVDRDFDFGPPTSAHAPAPAKKLAAFLQAPEVGVAEWDAPDIDWAAGSPMPLARGIVPDQSPGSGAAHELAGMLARLGPGGSVVPTLVPVEQVFLRSVSGPVEVTRQPIWLHSLLALRAIRDSSLDSLEVTTLIPLSQDRIARFRLLPSSQSSSSTELARLGSAGRILAIDRSSTRWERAPSIESADGFKQAQHRARLVARAERLVKEPVAILAVARSRRAGEESKTLWLRIQVPSDLDDSMLDIPIVVGANDRLYASAALGWPTEKGTALAASGALGQGDDFPFQDLADAAEADEFDVKSYGSGLSGRVTSLSLPARADTSKSALTHSTELVIDVRSPVFVALGRKVIFERPAPSELPVVAPPARHLSPTEARVVVPVAKDLRDALARVVRGQAAPIVPPLLERASLGLRPGAMVAEFDMLLFTDGLQEADAGDENLDPTFQRFGRPGHAGPRLLRQHRPPRAPALPRVPAKYVKSHGRRTFVELDELDERAGGKTVKPFLLMAGTGTVLRASEESFRIRVLGLPLRPGWDGVLKLHFSSRSYQGSGKPLAPALAELRVLHTGISAAMSIDGRVLSFTKASWTPVTDEDGEGIVLTLTSAADLTDLRAQLDAVDGDSNVFLTFRCAPVPAKSDEPPPDEEFQINAAGVVVLSPEPQRHFALRLAVRPDVRPSLPVSTSTLVFADPSYDRELSGPGAADTQRDGNGTQWKLALDRLEYGSDTPLYFAVGPIDPSTGLFAKSPSPSDAEVTFRRQTARIEAGGESKEEPLKIGSSSSSSSTIKLSQAYGITFDRLRSMNDEPVVLASGDQIVVSVEVPMPATSGGKLVKRDLSVRAMVVARPIIAPPPAVYALVVPDGEAAARVMLHATAPLPQVIEFPNLQEDLAVGHVRRAALFVWTTHELSESGPKLSTLVKVDRAGGGQVPARMTDLQPTLLVPGLT